MIVQSYTALVLESGPCSRTGCLSAPPSLIAAFTRCNNQNAIEKWFGQPAFNQKLVFNMVGPTTNRLSAQSITRWYFSWKPSTTTFSRQGECWHGWLPPDAETDGDPPDPQGCASHMSPEARKFMVGWRAGLGSSYRREDASRTKMPSSEQRLMAIGSTRVAPCSPQWHRKIEAPTELLPTCINNRIASDLHQQSRCPQRQVSSVAST